MKKKLTVLIAGPLPPPAGGISIHIQRLSYLLQDHVNLNFIDEASTVKPGYFHVKSVNIFGYLKRVSAADVFFIHSGSKVLKKIHILTGRLLGKKIIITIHGYGNRRAWPFRSIDALFFNMAHRIILVNPGIYDKVAVSKHKSTVMHAFLPPVMESEPALPAHISKIIQEARKKNQTIICANASRLDVHNGEDLYGVDMSIDATASLVAANKPVCFIFILTSMENGQEKFNAYRKRIDELSLSGHFFLLQENLSFVKLISESDMVLRPTNADGDALTVREAIYMGKPTLASDVVSRPEGTRLFKTRDAHDLQQKMEDIIKEIHQKSTIPETGTGSNEELKTFYTSLIEELAG